MKIYKVQTPLWWRTRLLNHVRCLKKIKKYLGYIILLNYQCLRRLDSSKDVYYLFKT